MKIVLIEFCIQSHFETLGFFFYLKKLYPDNLNITLCVWEKCFDQTWITFFRNNISDDITLKPLEDIMGKIDKIDDEDDIVGADILYVNTIDPIHDRYPAVRKILQKNNIRRCIVQKHIDKNFEDIDCDIVSLFPMNLSQRLLPPYDIGSNRDNILSKKIRLTVVGNLARTRRDILNRIATDASVTHFYRALDKNHMKHRIPGITYLTDESTQAVIDHLINATDYIFVDYIQQDRMTGIILHAISLEIPMIIRRSYLKKLDLPEDICIPFDTYRDIEVSALSNQTAYDQMIINIRSLKERLLTESIDFYLRDSQ